MIKQSASVILFLVMVLTLLFTAACAVSPDTGVWIGGTDVSAGGYWRSDGEGGITKTGAGANNYTVHYVHHSASGSSGEWGELTLNNADITKSTQAGLQQASSFYSGKTALYSLYPLTINLIGENTLKGANNEGIPDINALCSAGVCIPDSNALTIQGSGSLEASGGTAMDISVGMLVTGGVIIEDDATVIATGGSSDKSYGVMTYYGTSYCTIKSGRLIARAQAGGTISSALESAPSNPTSAYYWRIADSDNYTSSTTDAYTYRSDHTYVDICFVPPISVTTSPATAFLQGAAPETKVTIETDIDSFDLDLLDSVQMGPQGGTLSTLRDGTDYRKAKGSIIITLEPAYLNTLVPGIYALQINLNNPPAGCPSFVRTTITVNAPVGASSDADIVGVPKTGDAAAPMLWLIIALITGAGLAGSVVIKRKRQNG